MESMSFRKPYHFLLWVPEELRERLQRIEYLQHTSRQTLLLRWILDKVDEAEQATAHQDILARLGKDEHDGSTDL